MLDIGDAFLVHPREGSNGVELAYFPLVEDKIKGKTRVMLRQPRL